VRRNISVAADRRLRQPDNSALTRQMSGIRGFRGGIAQRPPARRPIVAAMPQ
jgi:hypothetical protein